MLTKESTDSKEYSYIFNGTFKVPPHDMNRLLNSPTPLKCPSLFKCEIKKTVHYDNVNNPNLGYSGEIQGRDPHTEFSLYLYPKENKVEWYYYVY